MSWIDGGSLNWDDMDDDAWDELAESQGFSSDGVGLILAYLCEVEGYSVGDAVEAVEDAQDSELLDMFSWSELADMVVDGTVTL